MNSKKMKRNMFLLTLTGALLLPNQVVAAADTNDNKEQPKEKVESVLNEYREGAPILDIQEQVSKIKEELAEEAKKREYLDMAFSAVREDSFLYIRSEPSKDSEWVGKLYAGYAAQVTGEVGEWTPITSGDVTGYVKTEYIITLQQAKQKAEELVAQAAGDAQQAFQYAESRAAEEARMAELERLRQEEEAKKQEELKETMAQIGGSGQAVVDYACQFIGNPYVWGGTSLTNGADCSGFIQSVYANFGVSMPRTSGQMRSAGVAVSYEQAIPGDVVCYEGHVGIYIGNGKVVNAIDEAHGIGISNAQMMPIITIRRLL